MSLSVIGDKEVVAYFGGLPSLGRAALYKSVASLAIRLQRKVMREKLSGQVLNVRTTRLKNSIHQCVVETKTEVVGIVSTGVEYARAHEYGFAGTVSVKEHLRRGRARMSVKPRERAPKSAGEILVRAHARQVNLPERSFLRSALREMRQEILEDMGTAVAKGIKGGAS